MPLCGGWRCIDRPRSRDFLRGNSRIGENLTFYEMMIRARAKHEIVIGYKNFNMLKPEVNPKNKDERSLNVDDTAAFVVMALGLPV